jgi:hypothetical protein
MFLPNRSKLMLAMVTVYLAILLPLVSSAQSKVEQLLNKLDENYYYPQNKGLIKVSSQLEWQQENIKSKKVLILKKPNFIFEGELIGEIFEKKIKPAINLKNKADENITESIEFLNNYLDAFLPKTLREKFSHYKGTIGSRVGSETVLLFKKIGSIQDFNDYELFIDEEKWRISKMVLRQNREPKKIEGKFFYARKAGKWVVEETLSIFKVNSQKYIEKTKYKYKNLHSFWMVSKIKQTVMQEGNMILSYKFNLNDYKLSSRR